MCSNLTGHNFERVGGGGNLGGKLVRNKAYFTAKNGEKTDSNFWAFCLVYANTVTYMYTSI